MNAHKIDNQREQLLVINKIKELPLDGTYQVEVKKVDKSSTAKQRRLKWLWNNEICQSGLGRHDTAHSVHVWNKYKFGHPIMMRDDEFYPHLFTAFSERFKTYENYPEMLKYFSDKHIRTELFKRHQNAEFLTTVQRYWVVRGVNLTDPDDYGRNLLKFKPKK